MAKLAKFLYSTALVVITAWLCSYFTRYGIANWYESFEKPAVTPPNEIFAPVWALIYGLMIVSFYQILTAASSLRQTAGQLFVAQLLLQIIWTFLFFYEGMLGAPQMMPRGTLLPFSSVSLYSSPTSTWHQLMILPFFCGSGVASTT